METHLMAFSLIEMQDLDELHNTVLRVVDSMKGMCIGMRFQLIELKLQLGCGFNCNTDTPFLLCGDFSPESFSVLDLETNMILGGDNITNEVYPPNLHYRNIAARLGIGLGGPSPFSSTFFSGQRGNSRMFTLMPPLWKQNYVC